VVFIIKQKKLAAQLISEMFLEHIRMISEGSCDTEDWSNDAEKLALPSQE